MRLVLFLCLACVTPAFAQHELDFWVGDWEVFDAQGAKVGANRIEAVLNGAALVEHWRDAQGGEGKSWFYFQPAEKRWKQVWVTDRGAVKEKALVESPAGGGVRFRGEIKRADGSTILDQTTLTPLPGGEVRQVIEQSADGGTTWKTGFDATYRRPKTPTPLAEAHQFDFWLGEWEVTNAKGKFAGTSKIEAIASGHALLENWSGAGGFSGKSLNTYNAAKKQWQQFWTGADGTVLELVGGLDAQGSMVLADASSRITWTPNADGSVRQLWETTKDGGKTWSVSFDGLYRKRR